MDTTEETRRQMYQTITESPKTREELEAAFGQVWDTAQMQQDFYVQGFLAPFIGVTRKSDGKIGTLMFQPSPRLYFSFEEA